MTTPVQAVLARPSGRPALLTGVRPGWRRAAGAAAGLVVVLVVWQIVAIAFVRDNGSAGAVPAPLLVAGRTAGALLDGGVLAGVGATAGAALTGYGIAVLAAAVLGLVVLLVPPFEAFAVQVGVIAACVPVAAISPIVVLLSPPGSRAVSVALAVLAVAFPMIIGVLLGLRAASPAQLDLVAAFGGGPLTALRRVRLVSAVPALLAALRIGAPAAFLGAMTGEFFAVGVDSGAGRLLLSQQYVGDYVGMWSVALLATVVSAAGYGVIALLERLLAPWSAHPLGADR